MVNCKFIGDTIAKDLKPMEYFIHISHTGLIKSHGVKLGVSAHNLNVSQ